LSRGLAAALRTARVTARPLAAALPQAIPACWQARACQTPAGGQPPQQTVFVPENALEKLLMAAAEAEGAGN